MKLDKIIELLEAEVVAGENLVDKIEVNSACGSDMMSDVLAYVNEQGLLLTGLCNPQVVRTAEMVDVNCVAFVRGKRPDDMVKALAEEKGIVLITTKKHMYEACGILYSHGLNKDK